MLSSGSLGVKSQKKKFFLLLSKTFGLFTKCIFHATTEDEKSAIQNAYGINTKVIVAQNLPEKKNIPFYKKQKEDNQLKLVSIARVAPEKNTLYALEILRDVKAQIIFDIYGPIYNKEYWNKCKSVINQLPVNIVVNYKDALKHDKIDKTLKNYHVLFLPSTGENFGHIIIEAMSNSCIPLISDKTPWKNLEQKNIGFDLSLNDKEKYVEAIEKLALMDVDELNLISKAANLYATNIINDKNIIEDYDKLFQLNN